jgi:hypothetical protein
MVARRIRRVVRHDASHPHGPERVHRVEVISAASQCRGGGGGVGKTSEWGEHVTDDEYRA